MMCISKSQRRRRRWWKKKITRSHTQANLYTARPWICIKLFPLVKIERTKKYMSTETIEKKLVPHHLFWYWSWIIFESFTRKCSHKIFMLLSVTAIQSNPIRFNSSILPTARLSLWQCFSLFVCVCVLVHFYVRL